MSDLEIAIDKVLEDNGAYVPEETDNLTGALTVAPAGTPPLFPLAAACLLQVYVDPSHPENVDLRIASYKCTTAILENILLNALQGVSHARAEAEAKDKSVKLYTASDPLPSFDEYSKFKI